MDQRCPPGARTFTHEPFRLWLVALAICALAAELVAAPTSISLAPTSLAFGAQPIGVSSSLPVTLTNPASVPVQFSLSTSGKQASEFTSMSACNGVVPAGSTCVISIRFTPGGLGNRTATLQVSDNAKASNKASVKLSGVGIQSASVSPTSLNFNNVATGVTSGPLTLTVTNNQTTPLSVTALTPSNPDYSATGCAAPLAAGASCAIAVTFRPTATPQPAPEPATLSIAHTGSNSPLSVPLNGTSVLPFTLTPASVTFPNTFQGQTSAATITVRNNQTAPTTVTRSTSAPFSVSGCTAPINGGATCTLTVQFSPVLAHVGAQSGSVSVSSTSPAVYTASTTLSGTALRPVTWTPTSLNFGGVTVASTSTPLQVMVTNNQPTVLTFGSPRVSFTGTHAGDFAEGAGTCGATLAGGASCVVGITFHPTVGGARAATANITSNAFGSPHPVSVSGTGTTPLTISPGSLAFGNVNVGLASASQAITIQNNQSVAAALTAFTFGGDFQQASSGTTCGASLPGQQSCVVAVVAVPTVAGPRAGTLAIESDTTESPNVVTLTANGVNGMTASVPSLTFAPQLVDTTSTPQQIVLTNHQAVPAALGTIVTGDFAAADACSGTVPAGSTCAVAITFTPTATGPRVGSVTFNNPGSAATVVALQGQGAAAGPPPAVLSVVPGAGTVGTSVLGVVVTGNESTNFSAASLVDFGDGITVSNLRNVSAQALTVDVAVAGGAVPGTRAVTVTTDVPGVGTEVASRAVGFVVSASANLALASITPDMGAQGQTLDVQIVGTDTHFQNGVTSATFGLDGLIEVHTVTVQDQTHATANVTVQPTADLGWRQVQVVTGGEIATIVPAGQSGPGFNVVAGPARLLSVAPDSGAQGAVPFVVTITGEATSFLAGASQVSFGAGINVGQIQVVDETQLTVTITVTASADPGTRNVVVTTGGEVASLADGFTVTEAPPAQLSDVTPNTGQQGQQLALTLTGVNTHFTTDVPAPSLTLGDNITVDSLEVVDDTTITASITIDQLAFTGSRQGTLSSGASNFPFAFTVTPSGAAISGVAPASGPQGGVVTVTVTGTGTHWQQGSTTAVFPAAPPCVVPTVNLVQIDSATQATLTISIPANACVGNQLLRLSTGGEILDTTFGVYAQTPSLMLGPASAMIDTTSTVNLLGEFTHFSSSTTAIIDGTGVAIQGFTVTSSSSATAKFVVEPNAPTGLRTVTLTTQIGDAFEVVIASFVVGATRARLVSVDPFHAAPGSQVLLTIDGEFTHFDASTMVGLGPDIQVGTPTVVSPTRLTVSVDIAPAAATGWRTLFINTGDEQLTASFRIDSAAAPSIQSVAPSGAVQGQSGLTVQITGVATSFNQTSDLILGAGVTVSQFVVNSPTTATAIIDVSGTAPVGPNTVLVITETALGQTEVATGAGFNVGRGPANILSITPNVISQNQIVDVSIVGQGTSWLQGGTTADFGPGITVAQFAVQDATHATAQLVALSNATVGFRTVTLITDGEIATRAQGIAVQPGTPVLLSSTPNAGSQNTSFTVTALGGFTSWQQDVTTASYGAAGVTVTGVTVVSPVSAILDVTIDPLTFVTQPGPCRPLTITTGDEQVTLANQLCVTAGAAVLTSVSPNAAPQGSTLTVQVKGQNTNFEQGLTQASFGDGITTNVTVTSPTTASVELAVSSQADPGFRTATLTTLGESASLALAFNVGPNTPTLNAAAPFSGQRDQSLSVRLLGQYTHWQQGATTVTFGEGVLVGQVTVQSATTLDVEVDISALATLGGRLVTVTTGGEIVSAQVFSVVAGGASISSVTPQSGNQGQQVTLNITGQNTNWQQDFTQFSIAGAGGDITVNFVVVDSATSATVGLTVAPTAAPGPRSVFMSTGPEALMSAGAFVVTGGVPAIAYVSPGSGQAGANGLAVEIFGLNTKWLTGDTTVDFGPGITVSNVVVGNDTHITAVVDIEVAAALGYRTVAVGNSTPSAVQILTSSFQVVSPQPPAPSLLYMSPTSGLRGQTFTINLSAANTHFDPDSNVTEIDFGDPMSSGIAVNDFQVTSPTTARVNITIAANAAFGSRTWSIVTHIPTGDEILQGAFSVVQATPQLTIVDPGTGMQGATLTVNLVGSFTGFNDTTAFDFGPGITVLESEVFGAAVARVRVSIDELAGLGLRYVTANTGGEVVAAGFSVTPSTAVVLAVTPNAAKQGESVTVEVTGQNTSWSGVTVFSFGPGVTVTDGDVDSATHATLTLAIDALASVGVRSVIAQTGGQQATLFNAFVVQPGTPLILSSSPSSGQQQAGVTLTILGQATAWDAGTDVDLGPGVEVLSVQPTSATALTVGAIVDPLTAVGPRNLTVTTGTQVLTLANAFSVTRGPAAIAQLVPDEAGQGETLNVVITGANTHFTGTTQAFFGAGVTVNGPLTVNSQTEAVANVTITPGAEPGFRDVSLVTEGETATRLNAFTVVQTVPYLQFVSPSSAKQGSTLNLTVTGALTSFTTGTVFDFGPGVGVNTVTPLSGTQATVNVTVSPVAARTTRDVSATTNGITATGANLFTVTAGDAYISAVDPAVGVRGQVALQVTISGVATHFTLGTPAVNLGPGVTVTQVIVDTDTQLRATVTIEQGAPVQANDVVVTTGGEVATLAGGFTVQQAYVSTVAPASAYQDQTLDVLVTGVNSHFAAGQTLASFDAGITVNTVTVHSPTQATVNVKVQLTAVPGTRTVTMTTGLESASGIALFTVLEKETPVISWATPGDIVYGTALGTAQLNATANTDGTFSYSPDTGTVLLAGLMQPLTVTFTPTNTIRYFNATATVYINVARAQQPALGVISQASAQYLESFQVTTTGGDGTGLVTFDVTAPCTNAAGGGTVTMTSGTGSCSITATKAGDNNFFPISSPPVTVTASKAPQAALTVTGAPDSAPNGTTFPVGAVGGSGTGGLTFAVVGPCTVAGSDVTMTGSVGSCSITATRAGDTNYLPRTSEPEVVTASGPVPPALDVLPSTASLAVPTPPIGGPALPGFVSVRLQAGGVNVLAPAGGVTITASSDNTACVTTTDGAIAANTYVGSFGIAYATASRPCTAIVTATAVGYGSDVVTVTVYDYADAPTTASATSLSYYNPALIPSPAGSLVSSVAALSYYNPALLPAPGGALTSRVASLSYYNPALLPAPTGTSATSVGILSYYNPALLPSPTGGATSTFVSVSYYNPAVLPTSTGQSTTNTASVSYQNGDVGAQSALETAPLSLLAQEPAETSVTVRSVSVANGPTAATVQPVRLSLGGSQGYTLRIDGNNLLGAAIVTLAGIEPYVSILTPVVSADGRVLTVDVLLAPNTPLGVVPVQVSGPGWTTPDAPGMRVEIAP